jgi:PAS domain S-box-containing protein
MARESGWAGLFRDAFKRSRNAMALLDEERVAVDVNPAFLELLGRRRAAMIGHPIYEFVVDGPVATAGEWRVALARDEFTGVVEMVHATGDTVTVQYAGHPETATGRRLVLLVALSITTGRRRPRDDAGPPASVTPLSGREQQVVRLIGAGGTGREIAEELQISHNTVRTHAFNAMTKLNARSRAELVAKALAGGHAVR